MPSKSPLSAQNISIGTGIVIVIMFIAMLLSGGTSSAAPADSRIDPSDPVAQQQLDQLQIYAKPEDVLEDIGKLDSLKAYLLTIKADLASNAAKYAEVTDKSTATQLCDKMIGEIGTIQANVKTNRELAVQTATQFLADRATLATLLGPAATGAVFPPKDGFALPVRLNDIIGYGNSAHNRSKTNPNSKKGHGPLLTGRMTFGTNIQEPRGDPVDLSVPANRPVFAPFTGRVARSGSCLHRDCSDGAYVVIESTDKRFVAALVHLNTLGRPEEGSTVTVGTQVGTIFNQGYDHLHFELWVDGKPVWSEGKSGNANKVIWANIKQALGF